MDLNYFLAGISVVIIIGLAFYAGTLISKIKMQTKLNNEQKELQETKQQQRNDDICNSIRTIARATMQKQCNVSEAAIRLTVLLEALLPGKVIDIENEYPALFTLFNHVKDMPTHDKRKDVVSKELKKLDKQRILFENELEEKILEEASQLANFSI